MRKSFFLLFLFVPSLLIGQINTDYLMNVGRNALYFQDYVLSIQYFNQVIKVKPYLVEPYFFRGIAKINLEDYSGAESDMTAVIERNPFMPMAYYARGFALKQQEEYERAEVDFTKALEFSPYNVSYLINRLEVYAYQEKYSEELADIEVILRRNKKMPELLVEKGRVLVALGDTVGGLNILNNYISTDSFNIDAYGTRALIKLLQKNDTGALVDYNRAIALGSQSAGHFINRGILNYQQQNFRGAVADYNQAVLLEPNNTQVLFNRALLRFELGDLNNAIADLNQLLKLDPLMYHAIFQRAIMSQNIGDHRQAIEDFSVVIEKYPKFVPAYNQRADSYELIGKRRLAYEDMASVIRLEQEREKQQNQPLAQGSSEESEESPDASLQIAKQEELAIRARAKLFRMNTEESESDSRFQNNPLRGAIQNRVVEVEPQSNFVLSFYQQANFLPIGMRSDSLINIFNTQHNKFHTDCKLINKELPLTNALINYHFKSISDISEQILLQPENQYLYLERGLDLALVQDFQSAIDDFTAAADYGNDPLAYFCRANVRYKQLKVTIGNSYAEEMSRSAESVGSQPSLLDKKYAFEYQKIVQDYDRVIALAPNFGYAWFNRGNVLLELESYQAAIDSYTAAIQVDPYFAEAYYNRGLAYIYLGDVVQFTQDLSKAGELGIFDAYSLLKKMR